MTRIQFLLIPAILLFAMPREWCQAASTRYAFGGSTSTATDPTTSAYHNNWVTSVSENGRPIVGGSDATGTVTTRYFNFDGQIVHKEIDDYVGSGTTPVRIAHWHYTRNLAGNITAEYRPTAWDSSHTFAANADGTFTITFLASDGLILNTTYESTGLYVTQQSVQQGTTGTVIPTVGYVYYVPSPNTDPNYLAGITRVDLVKSMTRYPDSTTTTTGEVTNYLYPDGFYDANGFAPKTLHTQVVLASGSLDTYQSYDTNGNVTWSKDANGSVSFNQYFTSGAANFQVQYAVRNINTGTPPSSTTYPGLSIGTVPTTYTTTTGQNLVTTYAYDSVYGFQTRRVNPAGDETDHYEKLWDSTNDASGAKRTFLNSSAVSATYDRVKEVRDYALHFSSGTYSVVGPTQVSFATIDGEQLSSRTSQATLANSSIGPGDTDTFSDQARTDSVYNALGRLSTSGFTINTPAAR